MSQKKSLPNPLTSKEAKRLLKEAVDIGDFELADKYYQDLKDLVNFEDEMELGCHVADYFDNNQILSTEIDNSRKQFTKDITNKISLTNQIFSKKLAKLQQRQENELKELADKWRQSRIDTQASAMSDYEQSIVTAKLVAGQCNFKEAAAIKTKSMRLRQSKTTKTNAKNDEHFSSQLKLMEKRHKIEIQKLIQTRNNEIHTLNLMLEEAPSQAGDCFQVENANNVVNVTKDFKHSRRVPLALQMQTIHGKRLDPEDGAKFMDDSDNLFTQRMANIDQTLTSPVPLTEKKSRKKKVVY
ncbi:hypothetical protein M9Y10_005574 [Tritrichomonas musculus]|uniref:Uncharacterized protein n=1 Tax=Tritrichomonas musculus TaxID=1915356 RepID=A0ABR2JCD1_9EUKA